MQSQIRRLAIGFAATAMLVVPQLASAQHHAPAHHARVAIADARHTALERVPGQIRHEELEFESHRWIYSFEIKASGPGIEEVNVDADTGAIVNVEHERG